MTAVDKLISIAKQEIGYLEKKSNKDLDSKTGNPGSNNFTKYARDLYPSLQGQPWCDMFVDWCFVKASAQYYKDKGQWGNEPSPGDQVFFRNAYRICHTGIVMKVTSDRVYTIEGNTSGASGVIANGGGVCEKSYNLSYSLISGYGKPRWSLVYDPCYIVGWHHDQNGWWYADSGDTYLKSCWKVINGHKYYFSEDGYALTDWQEIGGKWYYFEPRAGHPLECALYVSDALGAQEPGEFQ